MTNGDMLALAIVGVLTVWWLVKDPSAAGIGLVVLVGLVCFCIAPSTYAQSASPRPPTPARLKSSNGHFSMPKMATCIVVTHARHSL